MDATNILPTWYQRIAIRFSQISIFVGLFALLDRLLNGFLPAFNLQPSVAIGILLSGFGFYLLRNERVPSRSRLVVSFCAVVLIILASVSFYQHAFYWDVRKDFMLQPVILQRWC
jgi:hypothetical protein